MFIPRNIIPLQNTFAATSDVYLEDGHVCIKKNIAEKIFEQNFSVFCKYYPTEKIFLVAPVSEELFKQIHKASQQMLKSKNALGNKSISLQEILIDNDIAGNNRNLQFIAEESLHILKVQL
jgi:hypothetical protein